MAFRLYGHSETRNGTEAVPYSVVSSTTTFPRHRDMMA